METKKQNVNQNVPQNATPNTLAHTVKFLDPVTGKNTQRYVIEKYSLVAVGAFGIYDRYTGQYLKTGTRTEMRDLLKTVSLKTIENWRKSFANLPVNQTVAATA